MKRFKIEVLLNMGPGLPDITMILTSEIFIFHGGSSMSFTLIDECYPIPPELAEYGSGLHANGTSLSYGLDSPVTFDFYSSNCLIAPEKIEGNLTKIQEREKEARSYIAKAMRDGDIVIRDGEFIRGNENDLKKAGMRIIPE